jgi:hypothetical protein
MKAAGIFAAGISWLLLTTAGEAAQSSVLNRNGLTLSCSDFRPTGGGYWRASPNATLNYPNQRGSFGNTQIGPGTDVMNGVDVARFLSENCSH